LRQPGAVSFTHSTVHAFRLFTRWCFTKLLSHRHAAFPEHRRCADIISVRIHAVTDYPLPLGIDEDAEQTAHWVREAGRRPVLMPGDVSEQGHCREIIQQAAVEFGRLDILVNNAAMQRTHDDLAEISAEEWDRTFRTNIYSQFFLCPAAVPHMKPGAAIINTTSINAKNPTPQLLAYATTRGAIANFTAGLAGMLATKGTA
jgi:NAD(P)-dependent dehydrogenase (short-subunit alcohol dehydrogenase family)